VLDPFVGWIVPGFIRGLKIIKDNEINLIIATGPPFSSMVLGLLLSCITKTKLVLDYRDPWTNQMSSYCKVFGKTINKICERLSVKQASALVFCSELMRSNFQESLEKYSNAPTYVIYNGFFNNKDIDSFSLSQTKKNMIYAGRLYGERRIQVVAGSLRQLLVERVINCESFCFHVFGKFKKQDWDVIAKYGLYDIVKEHAQVPHHEVLKYMKGADILFLPSGSDVSYAVPFKFFDYLSVKRPILAITTEKSALADLMREIDCGELAFINDQSSIHIKLRSMILEERDYTYSGAEKYTWENKGFQYCEIIRSL
jgi:glycosyltransferase involved in cell wall biosynthesis